MTRAAIYVRVSTVRQAERDLSLPDQIAQCRAYCERQGWEVAEIFSEPGASALDEDRPAFQEMIYKATRSDRPFNFVVVHSLSRFSRDALHSELYVRKLRKVGVELVSITQAVTQDASGEMMRKLLNVFDEHQSRENAKHVHRAMCENTRQGFWNGSRPPFGYGLRIAERRGAKDKKVLVVNEDEAKIVRHIFGMATGVNGHPVGVKAIASYLNERGISRRGHKFGTSSIHEVLTATSYVGRHYFNKKDSRNKKPRPPSEWIELAVPAIVDEEVFNAAQALLRSRNPRRMPPRIANGPTLLAGVARCGHCGAALIQNTGKSGAYRYYCCSRKLKEGATSCRGLRMRMEDLDQTVIGEVSKRVLEPQRLTEMLRDYVKASARKGVAESDRLTALRRELSETEARLTRAMELIESGLEDVNDRLFRERYTGLKVRRTELESEIATLKKRMNSGEPIITPEKVACLGALLRDKLNGGSPEFRQAYARLILDEVTVSDEEIRISGSKDILARCASGEADINMPAVLSFVPDWRARKDSNL
jgi:site-specific DNA recombinase